MKRLVVACDGTWQDLNTDYPTNVVKFVQAAKPKASDEVEQLIYYDGGVGSHETGKRVAGGAFGWGLDRGILDAYRFLVLNWQPGDELYLVGFSRGAYTVRSLGGLLRNSGLVRRQFLRKIPAAYELYRDREIEPDDPETTNFRQVFSEEVAIDALCCFDTVGSLGIPDQIRFLPIDDWINAKYKFHDLRLSRIIRHAFHCVAIDERREVFEPTLMEKSRSNDLQTLDQVWFVGDHAAIGGGVAAKAPLSNVALKWLVESLAVRGLGLELDTSLIPGGIAGDPLVEFTTTQGFYMALGMQDRKFVGNVDDLHESVILRWKGDHDYRPKSLFPIQEEVAVRAANVPA